MRRAFGPADLFDMRHLKVQIRWVVPVIAFLWAVVYLGAQSKTAQNNAIRQVPRESTCDAFAAFHVLDRKTVESLVVSRAKISSALLGTVAARADIPVRVFVNDKGAVVCAKASGSASPFLAAFAEQAALKWRFSPYTRKRVKIPFQGDVLFHIRV